MIENLDLYRVAKMLVDEHGEDAATYAAMRADILLADGRTEAATVWKGIMVAVEELQRKQRVVDDQLH